MEERVMSGKVNLDRWGPHLRAAHRTGNSADSGCGRSV